MNFLITGHSRGLGAALTHCCLEDGHSVYGASRNSLESANARLVQRSIDIGQHSKLIRCLDELVNKDVHLDTVILNAGMLGPIRSMMDVPIDTFRSVMNVNVWANKTILDWLARRPALPKQIVLMSSGAGVKGNHGWSCYAMSKAALNMMAQLYAHEMPCSQILALAPGLVDTDMQEAIREVDVAAFPSVKRLQDAHGTEAMPTAETAARRILDALPNLTQIDSGSFVDLRKLDTLST